MRASDFLRALWTDKPPGYIELWALHTKRSQYLTNPVGADVIASEGSRDTYAGTCLASRRMDGSRRSPVSERCALAGLWLELDVNGGPDEKTGAAPDKADALTVAHALLEPTLLIDSGYGIHAWWLLHAPWRFATTGDQQQAATASAQWQTLHRTRAQAHGWTVDSTHDLARLLRVPGTANAKDRDHPVPVTVLVADGPRYERHELLRLAATAGHVRSSRLPDMGRPVDVTARNVTEPPGKLEALAFNSPEFAAALRHDPALAVRWDNASLSGWDLSLASQAAHAGWADQEIADLITWHRDQWPGMTRKRGTSTYYVRRTVSMARASAEERTEMAA
jgi:hypothetical protein